MNIPSFPFLNGEILGRQWENGSKGSGLLAHNPRNKRAAVHHTGQVSITVCNHGICPHSIFRRHDRDSVTIFLKQILYVRSNGIVREVTFSFGDAECLLWGEKITRTQEEQITKEPGIQTFLYGFY